MIGLMLKDLYNQKWQVVGFSVLIGLLALILLFSGFDLAMLGSTLVVVLSITIPITAMAQDEKDNWDRIAITMPVARRDLVLSKYALCLSFCLLASAALLLCGLLAVPRAEAFALALSTLCITVIIICILLALQFKLGVNKARLAFLLLFVLTYSLFFLFAEPIVNALEALSSMSILIWLLLLIVIVALSVSLSLKAYARKEF